MFERARSRDIDVVTEQGRRAGAAGAFIEAQGYVPNRTFNAMHGARRMLFYDEANGRQLDVFVNTFEMCHVLPVGEHLERDPVTVPLADLLLTKLQIVTLDAKDRSDAYALLLEHELGSGEVECIDAARIADLCARDWGLYRTLQINLERLGGALADSGLRDDEQRVIAGRLGASPLRSRLPRSRSSGRRGLAWATAFAGTRSPTRSHREAIDGAPVRAVCVVTGVAPGSAARSQVSSQPRAPASSAAT